MHPRGGSLWSGCQHRTRPSGVVAQLAGVREPPSPGLSARVRDRELIATSPSRGARFEGVAMWRPGGIRRVKASRSFRGHRMDRWRGRSTAARVAILALLASSLTAVAMTPSVTTAARAATSCPAAGCAVTVDAHDFATGAALANFNFIVNLDNTKLPSDPLALSTESYTPLVAQGNQDRNTVNLPAGRYLITVRSLDHKMWGTYITLPNDAATDGSLSVTVDLTEA